MSTRKCPAAMASLILAIAACGSEALAGTATLSLSAAATTSAGIFDSKGRLVRTLWSGRAQPAGAISIGWDGLDDDGIPADRSQAFLARLLAHNVRYVWEGVIGNTSAEMTGARVHRALGPIAAMAIDTAGDAFYAVAYNEQQSALHRFSVSDPQHATALAHDDYRRVFRYAATDGTLVYFADTNSPSFVMALKVSDGTEYQFSTGQPEPPSPSAGSRWLSVIDYDGAGSASRNPPSGLAVQRLGDSLFVAHAATNEVRVLDKRSGRLQSRIAVSAPAALTVSPDDSLWALCRVAGAPAVVRYHSAAGKWVQDLVISADLQNPVAVAASPRDGTLVVVDAGTEQLKAFGPAGARTWTLGRAGGYRTNGPDVTSDKFWFSFAPSYVAFEADGSFWVGDPANARNLHFSAQRSYLEQIMYLPKSYVSAVDPSDPTRVFSGFLEFRVDYSVPLHDSWSLVRNWAAGLDRRYLGDMAGLRSVDTLRNGRSYASVPRSDLKGTEIVELTTSSGARPTNIQLDAGTRLYPDGSLRYDRVAARSLSVYRRDLVGFDAGGNPSWGAPQLLTQVPALKPGDPYYHDVPVVAAANEVVYPDAGNGLIVSFNPGRASGFHLGAVQESGGGWAWRASPTGTWILDRDGNIGFSGGVYEIDRGVQYAGSIALTSGHQIVYGYHGEGWNGGQANQWLHFFDNGLFVGQFGRPVYPGSNRSEALPESAGNAFSPQLITFNGQLYLWHNDESVHSGMHRWRIDGTDTIRLLEAAIAP